MERWHIYEAYGMWVAEDYYTGATVWAKSLDELKPYFDITE